MSTSLKSSSLVKGGTGGITGVIANIVKKTCGFCKKHGETELVVSKNDTAESSLRFPVTVTSPRGSPFSKFVAVLKVPGIVVLKRRGGSAAQRHNEKVMTGSLLDAWPVITVAVLLMYATGAMLWFLVSNTETLKCY